MKSKFLLVLLATLVICTLSMTSCNQDTNTGTTTAPSSAATDKAATATPVPEITPEPPAELTLFMSNSGISIPESIDPNDNPYIEIICELANVKITELTIPPYADFQTRLNLMLSSNEIADLVHSYHTADINKAGAAGAFMEVSDIITNSPVISSIYTPEMLDSIRYTDGNIYHIRAVSPPDPDALCVRYDLVKELNDGVIPDTTDGWYELLKKLKEKYPDSIPLTDYGLTMYVNSIIFTPFGVKPSGWQYTFGEYIHCFEAAHMKDALIFAKKLYDEGLLSSTFVTNTQQDAGNQRFTQNTLVWGNNLASCSGVLLINGSLQNNDALIVPAPLPSSGYDDVDPEIAIPRINALNWGHNVAISSKIENLDGAVRLIETLLSEEVSDLFVYGIEGVDYEVVDGAKTLLSAASDPDHTFRLIYGFMQGYNSRASMDNRITQGLMRCTASNEMKEEVKQVIESQTEAIYAAAETVPSLTAKDFVTLSEEYTNKVNEASELAKSIIMKTIVGEITLDQYDAQVASFLTTYQSVTDEYNRVLAEVKAKYDFD